MDKLIVEINMAELELLRRAERCLKREEDESIEAAYMNLARVVYDLCELLLVRRKK